MPASAVPRKRWVHVKRGRSCPAAASRVHQDPDLEEEEDLVLTCEDDQGEELRELALGYLQGETLSLFSVSGTTCGP